MRCFLIGLVTVLVLTTGCDRFRYFGTAQQAGSVYLQGRCVFIGANVTNFHDEHGKWPQTLAEVIGDGILTQKDLLYPCLYDLPDRRDILRCTENMEWIYLPPKEGVSGVPLIMAPLPFTGSMGKRLPRPRRIIYRLNTGGGSIVEDDVAAIIGKLARD